LLWNVSVGGAVASPVGATDLAVWALDREFRMRMSRLARGFTLIELLIVVVIIGILAAIAIPKFQNTKGKAFASSLKSDLRNMSSVQEDYFYYNETYAGAIGSLNFKPSNGVILTITEASSRGWSATATHPAAFPITCAVYYGQAAAVPPATAEGQVACQ
jgi:type IV pilus assembly protein PilA